MNEKSKLDQFGIRQTWIAKKLDSKSKDELLAICVGLHDRLHDVQVTLTSSWVSKALEAADMMAKKRGPERAMHRAKLTDLLRVGSLAVGEDPLIQGIETPRNEALGVSLKETELQDALASSKAARAADKAGYEAVIADLRAEVARLKGGSA